jgi:hypothetical protein
MDAHVAAPTFTQRSEFEWLIGPQESPLLHLLAQGCLHDCGYRRRGFLRVPVLLHRVGQIIRKSNRCTLHEAIAAPFGEYGEVGDLGEYMEKYFIEESVSNFLGPCLCYLTYFRYQAHETYFHCASLLYAFFFSFCAI